MNRIKPADMKGLEKGMRIRIKGYRYAFAGRGNGRGKDVSPFYAEFEVLERREK